MTDRNWDAELAKIDKQLASISDEQLVAEKRAAAAAPAAPARGALPAAKPAAPVAPAAAKPAAGAWASWIKVAVAVAAAVGLMFWPWPARCGPPLLGFTAATGAVALLGIWSAIGTWRHRLGLAHVASLLVIVWGLVLGARETLPRIGYAIPTVARPAGWSCAVVPDSGIPGGGLPIGAPGGAAPAPGGR
jgi:hypothetical protein